MTSLERNTGVSTPRAADVVRGGALPARAGSHGARAWFALSQFDWRSVALVPADPATPAAAIANAIAVAGANFSDSLLGLLVVHGLTPVTARSVLTEIGQRSAHGERSLVVTDSPIVDPLVIPVARAVDACILVVHLGDTNLADARETITAIGEERFIGCITIAGRRR
jgi:hypothetical protein